MATWRRPGDVEVELHRVGHDLRPPEIVLVNTRAGAKCRADDYINSGCGMGKAATLWLLERGVRLVGTDGWSWDAPFSWTRQKVAETGDAGLIWEGRRAGREIGYSHLEKLHNLAALPADGFDVVCFRVKGASGIGEVDAGGGDPAGVRGLYVAGTVSRIPERPERLAQLALVVDVAHRGDSVSY